MPPPDDGDNDDGAEWFAKADKKTGAIYFFNKRGDVSYNPPPGFNPPTPQQREQLLKHSRARKNSWAGGVHELKLERLQSSSAALARRPRQRRLTDRPNPALKGAGIGEKRGTVLRALYGHVARFEDELTVRPGTYLVGIRKVEGGNWWLADFNGRQGHIPANYVEVIEDEAVESDSDTAGTAAKPPAAWRRPSKRPSATLGNGDGASPSGWFSAGASSAPPMRPPKPPALQAKQKPRTADAVLRDELAQNRGGNRLRWTFLAHTWGYAFAVYALVLGAAAAIWHAEAQSEIFGSPKRELLGESEDWVGLTVMACGALAFLLEYHFGLRKTHAEYTALGGFSLRPWLYVLAAVPCFFSRASVLAGITGGVAAALNLAADWNEERGESEPQQFVPRLSCAKLQRWSTAEAAVVLIFIGFNAGLILLRFVMVENERQDCLDREPLDENCLSVWASLAKGFGTSLDLTCALVLLPVLRATLNQLANAQLAPSSKVSTKLPVKKSLGFHKFVAYAIAIGSAGHIVAHMINFALRPEASIERFGEAALWSGGAITFGFTVIYCAAHSSVRKSYFEAFWYSHHAFLVVFPLLLAHGPKFWYAAVLMLPLYGLDRIFRAQRGTQPMYVDFVKFAAPVLRLHFFPERLDHLRFQEGQYVFIQVPHISEFEWHPFTISSAFGDLERDGYASLHIRVQGKGSWTWRTKEYFRLLSGAGGHADGAAPQPEDGFEAHFTHFDPSGVVRRGKYFGVDGKPLIRVDGPHAAPSQLYSLYEDVMLVGSGIGLTPSAAILSSVTRHKWRKGFRPETLRFYWVVRHSELESFTWFSELLLEISRQVLADRKTQAVTDRHRLEMNIYVTSVPSSVQVMDKAVPGATGPASPRNKGEEVGFSLDSLQRLLRAPSVAAREQLRLQGRLDPIAQRKLPNVLGDIFVWNGRPAWEQVFSNNKQSRREGVAEIGVTYCGSPGIASALKDFCRDFSSGDDCKFVLNKEVFG